MGRGEAGSQGAAQRGHGWTKENTRREEKKPYCPTQSNSQAAAGSPGTRQRGEGERRSCCLSGWTYIKLVHVNRREIEPSFVVTLMNPLLVTVNLFF